MTQEEEPIPVKGLKVGSIQVATELHLTGGLRAVMQGDRLWSLRPLLQSGKIVFLTPLPINRIREFVGVVGIDVFGGDEVSGFGTPLLSRAWTPLDGAHDHMIQPAVLWGLIAGHAERSGDEPYSSLARNISYSLHAAGIRLRDASDCYENQLSAAIHEKRKSGGRFSNTPIRDLQLAFHSVLSELSSARDYMAAALARKVGAPASVDALSRFAQWLKPAAKSDLRQAPVIKEMLEAYDKDSANPWLHQLTEYRNLFLHRQPIGAASGARWLRYDEKEEGELVWPAISMPLGEADPSAPGEDALKTFVRLYRELTGFARFVASHAPYEPKMMNFVASDDANP